jgi:hypothetical protein
MEVINMICKKCKEEKFSEFYNVDKTCKDCRKKMVIENRKSKEEYYKKYDNDRANLPHRVKARHEYAKTDKGKEAGNRAKVNYTKRNPIKRMASTIVGNAVRDGKISKPEACEDCSSKPNRLHGHHDDYAYPLVVRWLCPGCHNKWHKINGEGLNAT